MRRLQDEEAMSGVGYERRRFKVNEEEEGAPRGEGSKRRRLQEEEAPRGGSFKRRKLPEEEAPRGGGSKTFPLLVRPRAHSRSGHQYAFIALSVLVTAMVS